MSKKRPLKSGAEAFEAHFAQLFGDRWPSLRLALAQPSEPQALVDGLLQAYYLDAASVRAAKALGVQPGDKVLDLCAAPGGKTLVLAQALAGTGSLTSNDLSSDRRARLHRVVDEHLPPAWRNNLRITGRDATRWGLYEQNCYDRILLDAPCSSERHVVQSPKHLELWTLHRTKSLAQQGLALLCAALEALKPDGVLVYSTCSISPTENEEVLDRFEGKRKGLWKLEELSMESPDTHDGAGPLFWARLRKLPV
ncbi:MAG: SAM-dependent methyltransferase [Spirochaetales bacterium]